MSFLKDYSLNLKENDYHAYPAWSYSIIAKYAKEGFGALATLHDRKEPTPSMEFGSLFDSMLTKGKKTLDEYAVYEGEVPPAEKKVLDLLVHYADTSNFNEVPREVIMQVTEAYQYYPKWGFDARFKHLNEYADYYALAYSGKKIVSKQDWDDAVDMYKVFRNDPYLKELFGTKNTKEKEYLYQTQFCVDYTLDSGKEVKVKIMPDLLVVNHADKTIQPVDLKTSQMPAWDFKENFLKFRYDIQAKLYSDVLALVIDRDTEMRDYTILPYLFTDISRTDKVPVTYVYDQTDESQANGFTFSVSDKTYSYKSWQTLLDEIISYEEAEAKVPSYITTEGPNDLLSILSR